MPYLEQTDVNMTNHVVQSERNLKTIDIQIQSM
ncbi:hypothetical protein T01_8041 [Trichinella spiralis]|uniref:Uncharacterized protein n=1 Tax=Trichinella spiralis TaxID=6334 RepID=A0A0V0YVJ4_TRISP|nr:hypothetical protein T01_8041 [Trichinella spiralis]